MNELTIDGKIYISSKKAAEITGYAKDYVGQLCREGHVEARMVGRSWYVLESSIRAHRFGGDPKVAPISEDTTIEPESTLSTWEQPKYVPEMAPSMAIPPIQRAEPVVTPAPSPVIEETKPVSNEIPDTLTDMQAAWKEWFEQKKDHLIETPEIIDAREEEEAVVEHEVIAEPTPEPEEAEEPVMIQHIATPEPAVTAPEPRFNPESRNYWGAEEIEPASERVAIHHVSPQEEQRIMQHEEDLVILSQAERKEARKQKARQQRQGIVGPFIIRAVLVVIIGVVLLVALVGTGYAERFVGNTSSQPIFNILGGTSIYTR